MKEMNVTFDNEADAIIFALYADKSRNVKSTNIEDDMTHTIFVVHLEVK